jgi:HAE1 family hydrophobic/amphiphilic exporter-1
VGGMLLSTVLNLFFIPTLYVILSTLLGSKKRARTERMAHA